MGNVNLEHVEATIELWRPTKSMHAAHHPDDMEEDIESILFTDTNEDHTVNNLPVPRWEEVFDYYQLDPYTFLKNRTEIPKTAPEGTLPHEVCVIDRHAALRTIEKAVSRYNPDFEGDPWMSDNEIERAFYGAPSSIRKLDRQGEFDNLHLAPHMRQAFKIAKSSANGPALKYHDDIIMAPFCVHDCLHTHFRWGDIALPPLVSLPKSNKGWHGGQPYSQVGAPLVPENQSVYISLPEKHVVRYRAVAHKAPAGTWSVFNHHGSYYATGEWPLGTGESNPILLFAKALVWFYTGKREPWTDEAWGEMPSAVASWPALYWRLRFGGYQNPDRPQRNHVFERLTFNLAKCLR